MFTLDELNAAAELVHGQMPPTPQHAWPLLAERLGCPVVVKHENHTPLGAFKLRGADDPQNSSRPDPVKNIREFILVKSWRLCFALIHFFPISGHGLQPLNLLRCKHLLWFLL
jgi:hypothetical protein